jgi:hypothetical protein
MKRTAVIHPFLFALWPILFLYSQNLGFISFSQALVSLMLLLSATLVMLLLFTVILRSAMKAGAVMSLLLTLFFSFAHVHRLLLREHTGYIPTNESFALMVAWSMLFFAGTALIFRLKGGWQNITRILNATGSTLILVSLLRIGLYEVKAASSWQDIWVHTVEITPAGPIQPDSLPDIYYIILDGYGRSDILEELYDFDNSGFLSFLRQRGFHVATKSHSNYAQSILSIASSLNLTYLDDLAALVGPESRDRRPLEHMIQHSAVVRFLEQQGYTIVALPSGYSPTDLKDADVHGGSGRAWNEFEVRLLGNTPIPWLVVRGGLLDVRAVQRQKILHILNLLSGTSQAQSPHFVFAHVLAPHGPFLFDEHGNEIEPQRWFDMHDGTPFDVVSANDDFTLEQIRAEYISGYRGQLAFINTRVESIVDDLLSASSRPAVIILQADHGPASLLDWHNPDNSYYLERFAILNAYLLPGIDSAGLYDEITPVNTFRLIFNEYFGTDLELLDDASYFSTLERCYEFIDVTNDVRANGAARPSE